MAEIMTVIPVYNHGDTLRQVAEGVLSALPFSALLVVDDGSDQPVASLLEGLDLKVLRHNQNRGKGAAILSAAAPARESGFSHITTLDSDGQHDAGELPKFIAAIASHPPALSLIYI